MSRTIDMTGQKFGRLMVIKQIDSEKCGQAKWLCKCECGTTKTIRGNHLRSGHIKSCGCLRKENASLTKHGHAKRHQMSATYRSWSAMIRRCNYVDNNQYPRYGGRGIKVCEQWMQFESFLRDMGKRPCGCQIDRIDNDGDYCLKNCRWATPTEQARNTSRNKLLTFRGKTRCITEWAEELGINDKTIRSRLNRGWSLAKVLGKQSK